MTLYVLKERLALWLLSFVHVAEGLASVVTFTLYMPTWSSYMMDRFMYLGWL